MREGQSPTLAPLPVQYADFALWQRGWLQGEVLEQQLGYWRERLAAVPALELPTDRSRPAVASHRGATHPFTLPAALTGQLRRLGREQGATLYMTLLAAFEALLHRYSGQNDFAIGTPIANRTDEKLEQLIGFFVNTLALRASLEGNPSFLELLARVQKEALGGYAHQAVPFERLVEQLGVERDLSRSALFQVMFILQNTPIDDLSLAGLSFEGLPLATTTAKFDLTLSMEEGDDELAGVFEYATDLFDVATVERMALHFTRLLERIVEHPERRVSELSLLGDEERRELLVQWNDTAADFPRGACIHEQFAAQAQKTPDAIAVEFEGESLTYRELDERGNQLAHHLQSRGVGPDVRVGIRVERSLELIVGLLGILKAGGAYVPLDPSYPAERLAFMVEDAQISVLLDKEHLDAASLAQYSITAPTTETTPEHVAYVIYTSGSTGRPKGVEGLHRGALNRFQWMYERYPFGADEVCCHKTSLSFVDAVWEIFGPLLAGVRLRLVPQETVLDLEAFVAALESAGVTRLVLVPSLLRALLDAVRTSRCRSCSSG